MKLCVHEKSPLPPPIGIVVCVCCLCGSISVINCGVSLVISLCTTFVFVPRNQTFYLDFIFLVFDGWGPSCELSDDKAKHWRLSIVACTCSCKEKILLEFDHCFFFFFSSLQSNFEMALLMHLPKWWGKPLGLKHQQWSSSRRQIPTLFFFTQMFQMSPCRNTAYIFRKPLLFCFKSYSSKPVSKLDNGHVICPPLWFLINEKGWVG